MVPQHFLPQAMFDHHVPGLYPILYELIAHVNMFRVFCTRFHPVIFLLHCAHVVLIQYIIVNYISLCFQV